jgi:hypothetical protein
MRSATRVLAALTLLLGASAAAHANDNLISTVSIPAGQPPALIETNGVAVGTIRLTYTVNALQFPCGQFGQFNLGLADQAGSGHAGVYPATLTLSQKGNGTPVQLSANANSFTINAVGWSSSSVVTITIDCSKLTGSAKDGDVIDGQISTDTNTGAHLDTITSVQIHIKLVFPSAACLKLYSFESDQDTGDVVNAVTVNASRGKVRSTNPGQLSVDGLVVNTCSVPETFDLGVGLDPNWSTNPSGPGNATFTYNMKGEVDPSTYSLAAFGNGAAQGVSLCISNVTLAAGDALLMRVHSAINGGMAVTSLPTDSDFDFSATLSTAGSSCSPLYLLGAFVGPVNPATSVVTYTVH